jgi:hypothetical protein
MAVHEPILDTSRTPLERFTLADCSCPRVAAPRAPLALSAAVVSILCFAAIHIVIRLLVAGLHGAAGSLNVFTMLEAQRLWPALAAGPAAGGSLGFALAVYGVVYATMKWLSAAAGPLPVAVGRSRTADVAGGARTHAGSNGASSNGHVAAAPFFARAPGGIHVTPVAGVLAFCGGLAVHMGALALIERFVRVFPAMPDVVHAHLPYVDFGWPGELAYAAFMIAAVVVLFRTQPASVPPILAMLGLFYAVRGVFLFLMPIGMPPTAPPLASRFVFWPFASHAYFPGGHAGMMTVISLSVASRPWRRAFVAFTFAFAIGTLLARTHYAADALGGWLAGYAIVLWGRRRLAFDRRGTTPAVPAPVAVGHRWRLPSRIAGIFLLLVWVGPVTFAQTDSWQLLSVFGAPGPAAAESSTIAAGKAVFLEPGTPIKLRLRDGSTVRGRFLGRALLDSALYAPRFEEYVRASSYVPFTMNETLRVSLRDGRDRTAPFAGYAELTLLLRSPEGPEYARVPLEFISVIRRANGEVVRPKALIKAFHDGLLPSAEALVMGECGPMEGAADAWTIALRVPVEDIQSVSADSPSARGCPGGIIVLGVLAFVAIIVLTNKHHKPQPSGCQGEPPTFLDSSPRAHLTERPFDLYRGCFVGDPVAVADPWPGDADPATALADPSAQPAPAR